MLDTAIRAAREAAALLLEGSRGKIEVDRVERQDIKLAMDRKAEEKIISVLRGRFPDHAILSEECGRLEGKSDYLWVIDPLDGTFNFFHGVPIWCTSIGLVKGGEEILGVILDPTRDELFCAEKGKGAFLNGQPMRVSDTPALDRATIGFDGFRFQFVRKSLAAAEAVSFSASRLRLFGASALVIAYVACGRLDAFFQFGISHWDIAAGLALVREAGGKAVKRENAHGSIDVVATNAELHTSVLKEIGW